VQEPVTATNETTNNKESDIKDIMNAIDLLHDDVFNTEVKTDDDVILGEMKDVPLL
jgi:hypothetical protein